MTTFTADTTYTTRSICDSGCRFSLTVISRTAKTLRANVDGELKTLRIKVRDGVEFVMPCGQYSMAPVIRAA
jgi:hypothetical protein